jgi:trehalose 6-phosphate synthase/phosphatase
MQKRLERYNVEKWSSDFMIKLDAVNSNQNEVKAKHVNKKRQQEIIEQFTAAGKRIFFLDYDGTLRGFVNNPSDAKPDLELLAMITQLQAYDKNEVVIISGRDSITLGEWFKDVPVTLIAEHGVLKKTYGKDWELTETMNNDWVPTIQPVLQTFVDRTPGTFIEKKNYSIAWHYRKADPQLGKLRANELSNVVRELTSNHGLSVLSGNKVIEIKSSNVHKGKAANNHILNQKYDFIFCIGDDWTDEFMFNDLPETAITVKVGVANTAARYYVDDTDHVREVLQAFLTA